MWMMMQGHWLSLSSLAHTTATDNIAGRAFPELIGYPIDVVYTWVNGSDPRHIEAVLQAKIKLGLVSASNETDATTSNRFQDNEELRYSLRSIEKFAGWVRHIYLVTNGQIPYWLNLDHPRITVVTHEELFLDRSHLPTFSSPAIEVHLHRIPGLSRHWLYFNDDVVLGNYIWPSDFYTEALGQNVYLSWDIPNCVKDCAPSWLGDGYCDPVCNVSACEYDEGDCLKKDNAAPSDNANTYPYDNASAQDEYLKEYYNYLSYTDDYTAEQPPMCNAQCTDYIIGDRYCDRACCVPECGFDAGDCGYELLFGSLGGFDAQQMGANKTLDLASDVKSFYVNLTSLIGSGKVVEGTYDNSTVIRNAIISSRYKTLVVTLRPISDAMAKAEIVVVYEQFASKERREFSITVISHYQQSSKPVAVATDTKPEEPNLILYPLYDPHYGHDHDVIKQDGGGGGNEKVTLVIGDW